MCGKKATDFIVRVKRLIDIGKLATTCLILDD
jgi:hypothetical protein